MIRCSSCHDSEKLLPGYIREPYPSSIHSSVSGHRLLD